MKLSKMILNSIAAVADYNISFEAKMIEIERLQGQYQKALESEKQAENEKALEWYNATFPSANALPAKKLTKLQTLINAVQSQLDNGLSISEAVQSIRSSHLKKDYIKTERAYVSKLKAHFK